jgi:hypothetical protein
VSQEEEEYQIERLDHLGIVAGVCKEAGIAEWLDKLAGEKALASLGACLFVRKGC